MSVPSASYTQGSTVSFNLTGMTSNTSRVATSNSNVSIISDDQESKANQGSGRYAT